MEVRYIENSGLLSEQDMIQIQNLNLLLVGVGGIGGNLANQLIRLGVTSLTIVDFDVFDESNLNRQLFSNETSIGKFKVDIVKQELLKINSKTDIKIYRSKIEDLLEHDFDQYDIIIDAVDSIQTKIYLSKLCKEYNKPLLHGSCAGWYGQVGILESSTNLLQDFYQDAQKGLEETLKNPPFAPAIVSSIMISELVKYITDSSNYNVNELIFIDLKNNSITTSKQGGR